MSISEIRDCVPKAEREAASRIAVRALRRGELVRPDACAWCGVECKPHMHHPDYARPLMVVWICASCHAAHHAAYWHERWLFDQAAWERMVDRPRRQAEKKITAAIPMGK